jgi:hypothetical protein
MGNEGSVIDEQIVVQSGKGQILCIFSCTSGGRTSDDTQLSKCIEQVTIEQAQKNNGVLNFLNSIVLRFNLKETESKDLT